MIKGKLYYIEFSKHRNFIGYAKWSQDEKEVYDELKEGSIVYEIDLKGISHKVKKVTLTAEEPKSEFKIET